MGRTLLVSPFRQPTQTSSRCESRTALPFVDSPRVPLHMKANVFVLSLSLGQIAVSPDE